MYGPAIGFLYLATALANPQVYFPVNAQVPPVARVAQPFQYQFSPKTCVSDVGASLTYTLQDAPSWLSLDSTRTLSGTPSANDLGPVDLKLVATDSTGSLAMPVTLIVVDDVAPAVQANITQQLSKAGSLVDSNSVELQSGTAFSLIFSTDTFSNVSNLYYYATSADRSPLPSWLVFTATTIAFSGTAPLTNAPQEFGILLSASSIAGFAETSVEFNLVTSNHILAFEPLEQLVQVNNSGAPLSVSLAQQLLLDGKPITSQQLSSISANTPSSLKFDNKTLTLTGILPAGNQDQMITFNATDIYGDTASGSVRLAHQSAIFAGSIGTLSAVIGQDFSYKIPTTLFKSSTVSVANVSLGSAASWLQYDATSMTIHGKVPESTSASTIAASLTATSGTTTETQSFTIRLVSASASQSSTTPTGSSSSTTKSASASTSSSALAGQADYRHKISGLTKGAIAAAVIFPVLFVLALLIALLYCIKKRAYYPVTNRSREKAYHNDSDAGPKRGFFAALSVGASKPAERHGDVEKSATVYREDISHKSSSSQTLPTRGMSQVVGAQEYSDDSTLAAHEEHVLASIDRTSLGPSAGSSPRRGPHPTTVLPAIVSHSADNSPSRANAKRKSVHSMQESSQRPLKRLSINRFSRGESVSSLHGSPRKTHRAKQSSWVFADKFAHRPQESISEVTYNSNRYSGNASHRVSALTSNSNPFRASTRITSDAARRSIRLVPVDEQFSERRQNYFRHRRRTTSSQHSPWFTGSIDNRESMVSRRMTPYGSRYGGSRARGRISTQSIRSIQSRSSDALGPSFAESPIAERSNDDWEDLDASDLSDKENENVIHIVPDSIRQSRRAKWSKRLQRDGSGQVESWRTTSMQSRVSSFSGRAPSQRKHSALSVVLNDASWYSKLSAEERRERKTQEEDASSGIMAFI